MIKRLEKIHYLQLGLLSTALAWLLRRLAYAQKIFCISFKIISLPHQKLCYPQKICFSNISVPSFSQKSHKNSKCCWTKLFDMFQGLELTLTLIHTRYFPYYLMLEGVLITYPQANDIWFFCLFVLKIPNRTVDFNNSSKEISQRQIHTLVFQINV